MARLYKERKGVLHIYCNRMPRPDGGNPLLGWAWCMGLVGALWALGVAVSFLWGERSTAVLVVGLIAIAGALPAVLQPFQRVVFSAKKREAHYAIFFYKWGKIPFGNIAEITLSDQEMQGKTRYIYFAQLRDEFSAPLRLSPRAKSMRQLSRYYYEIIPALAEMLAPYLAKDEEGSEVETLEVAVESVEIPNEKVEAALADSATFSRNEEQDAPAAAENVAENDVENKGETAPSAPIFKREGNVYSRSLWRHNLTTLGIVAAIEAVITGLLIYFLPSPGVTVYVGIAVAIPLHTAYQISRENMDFVINMNHQAIRFRSLFGLKKHEYGFGKMGKFAMKSVTGQHALCLELKGHKVDPTVIVSTSPKKIKEAYLEVCRIMEIDPKRYWKT